MEELRNFARGVRAEYEAIPRKQGVDRKNKRDEIIDFVEENIEKHKYSKGDLNAIAYWAVTDEIGGNFTGRPNWETGQVENAKYTYKFNELISLSDDIANIYVKYSTKGINNPDDFTTLGKKNP
jgi:hypothetical protein